MEKDDSVCCRAAVLLLIVCFYLFIVPADKFLKVMGTNGLTFDYTFIQGKSSGDVGTYNALLRANKNAALILVSPSLSPPSLPPSAAGFLHLRRSLFHVCAVVGLAPHLGNVAKDISGLYHRQSTTEPRMGHVDVDGRLLCRAADE